MRSSFICMIHSFLPHLTSATLAIFRILLADIWLSIIMTSIFCCSSLPMYMVGDSDSPSAAFLLSLATGRKSVAQELEPLHRSSLLSSWKRASNIHESLYAACSRIYQLCGSVYSPRELPGVRPDANPRQAFRCDFSFCFCTQAARVYVPLDTKAVVDGNHQLRLKYQYEPNLVSSHVPSYVVDYIMPEIDRYSSCFCSTVS